jgi:hypothetical protein
MRIDSQKNSPSPRSGSEKKFWGVVGTDSEAVRGVKNCLLVTVDQLDLSQTSCQWAQCVGPTRKTHSTREAAAQRALASARQQIYQALESTNIMQF